MNCVTFAKSRRFEETYISLFEKYFIDRHKGKFFAALHLHQYLPAILMNCPRGNARTQHISILSIVHALPLFDDSGGKTPAPSLRPRTFERKKRRKAKGKGKPRARASPSHVERLIDEELGKERWQRGGGRGTWRAGAHPRKYRDTRSN